MTFDVSPMQSTASPIALLAGLQGAAASDDFAAILDRGALPEQTGDRGELTDSKADATALSAPGSEAIPAPAVAALAIAHADALVATLAPKQAETMQAPEAAPQIQVSLPAAARPVARRDAPASLPMEEPEEESAEAKQESGDAAPQAPVILALPEGAAAQRPVDTPVSSPEPVDGTSTKRAATPVTMRGMTDQARLPEKVEREIGRILQDAKSEPAKTEGKPAPIDVERASADRPAHIDLPASAPLHTASAPKAAPVRGAKIAEIALGLADRLPDPTTAIAQKQVADIPAPAPVPTASAAASASPADMIVDRQLDLVRNEQWLGELAHDIASTAGDNNRLSFRLMPHQLGRLDVDVTRSHNGLSLAIHTESDSAQAILSAAQPRLADEIRAQGLKLADTQMFSGDARHSPGHDGHSRPAPPIETFTTFTETVDTPEPEQRDGRYA